jgi:hypothetical protein
MYQRVLSVTLLVLAVLFFSARPALALADDEMVKLPNGRVVKILSVSKIEYSKGIMALMVRYQTHLSVEQHKLLSEEVDDVWKLTQRQVERLGYTEAILSSNEITKGIFLTASRVQNFIYEKGSDGNWTRLNRSDFMASQ